MSRLHSGGVEPGDRYADIMLRIRQRFDTIESLSRQPPSWSVGESIGTHLRKIIEGIAFGCVVAMQHSTKVILRKAVGHWNAENIFTELKKSGDFPYPDPNEIRYANKSEQEKHGVRAILEGQIDRRISVDALRAIYRRTHPWTHEDNPYVTRPIDEKNYSVLLDDAKRVKSMLRLHRIGIKGESFICTIEDSMDGQVKVQSVSKVQDL